MKTFLFCTFFACCFSIVKGQDDPQAKQILSQVTAKSKSYKTVSTNFTVTQSNNQNNEKTTRKGSLLLKGDKYCIKMPESEIYFDGKDIYNYLPESKEVNITKPQAADKKNDDFSISNPKELLKISDKDFKSKLVKESQINGKKIFELDLYPVDLHKKYSRIHIQVDQLSYQLITLKAYLKDGQQYSISFDSFQANKELADALFIFDKSKHTDTEVIDLRF